MAACRARAKLLADTDAIDAEVKAANDTAKRARRGRRDDDRRG